MKYSMKKIWFLLLTSETLPDGWEALETSDGTKVYANSADKELQWDKPKGNYDTK